MSDPSHLGIYKNIRDNYGDSVMKHCRRYVNTSLKIARQHQHIAFNTRCRHYEIIPRSLRVKPLVDDEQGPWKPSPDLQHTPKNLSIIADYCILSRMRSYKPHPLSPLTITLFSFPWWRHLERCRNVGIRFNNHWLTSENPTELSAMSDPSHLGIYKNMLCICLATTAWPLHSLSMIIATCGALALALAHALAGSYTLQLYVLSKISHPAGWKGRLVL